MVASAEDGGARRAGQVLQPLGQVHGVADDRVLEPLVAAEQRGGHLAGRHADAQAEGGQAGLAPALVQLGLARCIAAAALTARSAWSVWGNGGTEDGDDGVADVLHHGPLLGEDRAVHLAPVLVQLRGQHREIAALGDAASSPARRT